MADFGKSFAIGLGAGLAAVSVFNLFLLACVGKRRRDQFLGLSSSTVRPCANPKAGEVWSSNWKASLICSDGFGGVFVIVLGALWHVTERNKNGDMWLHCGHVSFMCPDGDGGVFIISEGNLCHVTSRSKAGVVWSSSWQVSAMCWDGSCGLFIITSEGELKHVTEDNSSGEVWSSKRHTSIMCVDADGGVFLVIQGSLWHVPDAEFAVLWSSNWQVSALHPDGRGGIYILTTQGALWHATEKIRGGTKWSSNWEASFVCPDEEGGIMIISRGSLYHVNDRSKHGEIWSYNWDPSAMCSDGHGGIFLISRGHLKHAFTENSFARPRLDTKSSSRSIQDAPPPKTLILRPPDSNSARGVVERMPSQITNSSEPEVTVEKSPRPLPQRYGNSQEASNLSGVSDERVELGVRSGWMLIQA